MNRSDIWVALSAVVVIACGSSPPIAREIRANPTSVCRGRSTTVQWSAANGRATLHVTPEARPTTSSSVPPVTSRVFNIFHPTDFRIEVRAEAGSAPPAERSTRVDLFAGSTSNMLGTTMKCSTSGAEIVFDAALVADREGLLHDFMHGNRPMTVHHERTGTIVDRGVNSTELRGTPLEGNYHIVVPLRAGERCTATSGGKDIVVELTVVGSCPEQIPNTGVPPIDEPAAGVGLPDPWRACGAENQGCCGAATCQTGLTCQQLSVCTRGTAPATTCSGRTPMNAQLYSFAFKDRWGCAISGSIRSFLANTAQEARECAETEGGADARPAASIITHNPTFHIGRGAACHEVYPAVFDEDDAETCAMHIWCVDDTCKDDLRPAAGACESDD